MIDRDDLRAAVAAGTITEAQAARIVDLSAMRRDARVGASGADEPFALFRGFNEIFILVGLAILGFGWLGFWAIAAGTSNGFGAVWTIGTLCTFVVVGLLSEYFVRRRRMVAPAIALSIAWTVAAGWLWLVQLESFTILGGIRPGRVALVAALTGATVFAYWLRYRVPFAMALIALAAFATVLFLLSAVSGETIASAEVFLLSGTGPFAWGTILLGIGLFAMAMRFDMSDPHRMTLRSANGFWLHVVAAPAIVNTVAITLLAGGEGDPAAWRMLVLSAFLVAMALIAVIIDRRSSLVSSAGYIVVLAGIAGSGIGVVTSVLAIGVALLILGAQWVRIRAALLRRVGGWLPLDRLPPAHFTE
ncbi:hypothetical protein [Jannaschia sp. LMIT008]|uniref:hypothetical protein n=1 Tax=Jannaschia maritima TaxID=3032585 RepID=UPI002811EC45|nr:hypothetical protein [Jannaschia sp. LMIT008]